MAKPKENPNINVIKDLNTSFNQGFNDVYKQLGTNSDELVGISSRVDSIINSELTNTKSITTDDMSVFLVKLFNSDKSRGDTSIKSIEDIFNSGEDSSLVQFFQERYRNRYMLFDDLDMITNQLAEMEEAILATRDAMISADDISNTVSRTINFENVAESDTNITTHISTIEQLEKNLGLNKKVKNQIVTNTLRFGTYYAYVVPYSKLFEQQMNAKNNSLNTNSLKENLCEPEFIDGFKHELENKTSGNVSAKDIANSFKSIGEHIEITNESTFSIPLIEGIDISPILDGDKFKDLVSKIDKEQQKKGSMYTDGVKDVGKDANFSSTTGCYIKFIDPRRLIPIRILDNCLGYYYIHESNLQADKSSFSSTIRVTNIASQTQSDDLEHMFLSKITDKIVSSFDKKFLESNTQFKDLILKSLLYNDLYKKKLTFQFIPAEYISKFTINENETGDGESVLSKSLFYAKLYLALLIFKMISIVTRSNDTRIYYVRNSGIDGNITNKIQDVARSMKSRQINFMDLMNYNSIISKIGHYKDIYMPVGRSGERGIEFDTLQGQDIPLNTDLMEMLKTNMINATGVPSVIMNYVNEADYAKTLQMANAKFVLRVVSNQLDLDPCITDFYKKVMRYSNIGIGEDYISKFTYNLNTPRALNTINNADNISTGDQLIVAIIKARFGDAEDTEEINIAKDIMYRKLARKYLPMFDWKFIDDIYRESMIDATEYMSTKSSNEQ